MLNLKSIKIHTETYDKLIDRQRFNEGFDREINRILSENDIVLENLKRLINVLSKMRSMDTRLDSTKK